MMQIKCCHTGCTAEGIAPVEDNKWLCTEHTHERIHIAQERTEADEELQEFCDEGGKVT
jgi:hypothetical protein